MEFQWRAHQSMYVRSFLKGRGISRRLLNQIKYHGGKIIVNGHPETVKYTLQVGDIVQVTLPPEQDTSVLAFDHGELPVLYEDDHYLIINKPPGLTSIPVYYDDTNSIANWVKAYYESHHYENQVIHIVTRLDRLTSGGMVIAKHRFAHTLLEDLMLAGDVTKVYTAYTNHPVSSDKHGWIEAPIGRKDGSIIERCVTPAGKPAKTEYWMEEKLKSDLYQYRVQIHTGRTHQIRVHFAHQGAPLVGDTLYGGNARPPLNRQALHCCSLSFTHPITREALHITAPLSSDIREWLQTEGVTILKQ
ncbi:MAG: RluA family pseudouridine synthase [Aerococcus sp.]|nr:RluA family pseudouridine synthase [Aerococcus sp.]